MEPDSPISPRPPRGRPSQRFVRKGVERRFEEVAGLSANRLAGGLYGIANRSRDGTHLGLPFRLPARDRWPRSDLPQRVGMACTSQPSPVARQASREGGRSGHGLRFRRGAAAPEAVV